MSQKLFDEDDSPASGLRVGGLINAWIVGDEDDEATLFAV
jgi:hypothetical protein